MRLVRRVCFVLVTLIAIGPSLLFAADPLPPADIVVYGGTSGGIASAIQGAKLGHTVLLIEPGTHLGGLTTGGLGATDIGNKAVIGGIAREFYQRVGRHYANPASWTHAPQPADRKPEAGSNGEKEIWTFEPHVAMTVYRTWLAEYPKITLVMQAPLDRTKPLTKQGAKIVSMTLKDGRIVQGKMFIDATYEGDLMALAGVAYHVGRESTATYGENLNGVTVQHSVHHQFIKPVDPYRVPGDPKSGLIPLVQDIKMPPDGSGDRSVQAYNYRLCATDVPENRLPWPKPANYREETYELLFRNFEAGDHRIPWNPVRMPNRKTDSNNNFAVSTDYIGANYGYANGTDEERKAIIADHISYQQGLMWSLANHPRVPEKVREHFQTWGMAKDEFAATNHWPPQLYVREARRMISDLVMVQDHCQGRKVVDDAVGMAAYNMDSHNCQRYVDPTGHVRNEGDVQVGVSPYPVSYQSIRPRAAEATNLLVPVCLAASHIAYGSIRMEPVFMVLGQSSATAASLAIRQNVTVQQVPYPALREQLLKDHQVLEYTKPVNANAIDSKSLKGVVATISDARLTGEWSQSSAIGGYVAPHYVADGNEAKGQKSARFELKAPEAGQYAVVLFWNANENRATNVPVTVRHGSHSETLKVNQRQKFAGPAPAPICRINLEAGETVSIEISNAGTDGYVIVNAAQLLPTR